MTKNNDPQHQKKTELETELDDQGMSFSPTNAGEIGIVPANSKYASRHHLHTAGRKLTSEAPIVRLQFGSSDLYDLPPILCIGQARI